MKKSRMYHPVQQGKNSFKKVVMDDLVEQRKKVFEINRNLRKIVGEEVKRGIDAKMREIKSILYLITAFKEALIKKGMLDREEVDKEFEEIRKRAND